MHNHPGGKAIRTGGVTGGGGAKEFEDNPQGSGYVYSIVRVLVTPGAAFLMVARHLGTASHYHSDTFAVSCQRCSLRVHFIWNSFVKVRLSRKLAYTGSYWRLIHAP